MSDLKPIGLQLYSVREALSADFAGTVRAVADIGYVGVEPFAGMTNDLQEAASLFRELELEVLGSHIPYPDDANQAAVLETAEAFGLARVCIAFMPPARFATLDAVKRACEQLNRAGEFARANGLELGYHNHWWEYKELDGIATLDLMLSELDDQIFLQIDTYWTQVGGLDAAEALRQVGARAPLIHLKDGSLDKDDDMTALGQGRMDVPGIVAAAKSADWHIVELDRCATDMLAAVRESCEYLAQNGLARGR